MEAVKSESEQVAVRAENIGGIEHTEVGFEPGVTILTGRNATHRTSFLQAVMAGLGSERASLKGDAETGEVTLRIGEQTYTRTLERQNGTVAFGGDPYLEDAEVADLFAFLLESNEARRTVALDGDLREIIMEPIDSDAIKAEIERLKTEKDGIDEEIEQLESLKRELPEHKQEVSRLDSEIEEKRAELEEKRAELEAESAQASEVKAEQSKLEAKMSELQRARSSLEQTEFRMDSQRESLETLEERLGELESQKEELAGEETEDLESVRAEIQRLQDEKGSLNAELNKLQSVIQFNEEMMDGTQGVTAALDSDDADAESLTDQLVEDGESVVCWTCGTTVDEERVEETLEQLREFRETKYSRRSEIDSELDDLKRERTRIESAQRQRESIDEQIADVRSEIEEREAKLDDLESERTELDEEIEQLEAEIEALEEEDRSEVLDKQREVNRLEIELEQLEDERDRISENIEEIESRVATIDDLEAQKEGIKEELTDLRTRIERIEEEAIENFNEHMDAVLDILDYTNIDRIWVERTQYEGREGRRKVIKSKFDLHVVRSTADGVTYEDEFEHLSESEREVTGLVFALAGYLAHEVYEKVPFILLDSLEAIDAERIARLVEYIGEYADYLLVALLPEDAAALDDSYERITGI
jgi:predicted  nucleic acid-binding Zn-ribbon protein